MTTPNLMLPEVPQAIQGASDEINAGFLAIDAVLQLAVIDKDAVSPPLDAVQGDRYIVPESGAIGSWSGWARSVAFLAFDGWRRFTPRPGWRARVLDEAAWYVYNGSAWEIEESGGGDDADSAANVTPDTHPETPNAADDEFEEGTSIDTGGSRTGGGATAWAWHNQGLATAALSQGSLVLRAPASASESFRIVEQATSGATWKYRAKVSAFYTPANFAYAGMVVRNSSNNKLLYFGLTYVGGHFLYTQKWNSATSFSVNITGLGYAPTGYIHVYLEVELTATQVIFRNSFSGLEGTFFTHSTENIATFLVSAPDRIGLAANSQNSNIVICGADWFRKVA